MSVPIDLTGQKFGRLTVVGFSHNNKHQKRCWSCVCECGKTVIAVGGSLKSGNTTSCGCVLSKMMAEKQLKHGLTGTRLYRIWQGLKRRCENPNTLDFQYYGAKGITVCEEWRLSPEAFVAWAVASGYNDDLTLDRKENHLGYSPENCRWATLSQQARNTTRNKQVTVYGETMCFIEAVEKFGVVSEKAVRSRLRYGFSFEAALKTPKMENCGGGRKRHV